MERHIQMRIASAMAEISMQTTRRCKEDYLYEIVSIVNVLDDGGEYTLFARSTGADGISRFVSNGASLADGINAAEKSLGVDCAFIFSLQDDTLLVKIHNVILDKSTMWSLTNGFDARRIRYEVINQ